MGRPGKAARAYTGTLFKLNTDGTGYTNFYTFSSLLNNTNSDGANPQASLILSGSTLYGAAENGGPAGSGTLFAINTNGTGFTNFYIFTLMVYKAPNGSGGSPDYTNSDGANPYATLILSGGTLYGTAFGGGTNGQGTVFAVGTNGAGFATFHNFACGPGQ